MEISYERKHNDSYMVIDGKLEPSYETKMIKANSIKGLLEVNEFSVDGVSKLSYKISRKENLEDYLETKEVDLKLIQRVVINLQMALDELEKYLIHEEHILLSTETVFLEKGADGPRVSLCYYPKSCGSIQGQFKEVMEYMLSLFNSSDRQAVQKIYEAYDITTRSDYALKEVIDCLQEEIIPDMPEEIYVEKVSMDEPYEYVSDYYDYEKQSEPGIVERVLDKTKSIFLRLKKDKTEEYVDNDDFVIEPDYELEERTELLSDSKPVGRLVYDGTSNEDDFIINKDIFRIGSSKNNDAVLKAKTVSGSHAKITKEGNDYFITDSNSLNGSFLNSIPLAYRKPYKLRPLDVIRFASESYIFM
ncbi:MAG: FHA domain-containing protein [Pseudobutyrivibrio sp.]|nr:FHA domain-containing protein [Pseudobutyrivibrio sp.]